MRIYLFGIRVPIHTQHTSNRCDTSYLRWTTRLPAAWRNRSNTHANTPPAPLWRSALGHGHHHHGCTYLFVAGGLVCWFSCWLCGGGSQFMGFAGALLAAAAGCGCWLLVPPRRRCCRCCCCCCCCCCCFLRFLLLVLPLLLCILSHHPHLAVAEQQPRHRDVCICFRAFSRLHLTSHHHQSRKPECSRRPLLLP